MNDKITEFVQDNKASISALFALLAVPLLLAVGTAIDTAQMVRTQARLQKLVDTTAIAGAALPATSDENRLLAAEGIYAANALATGFDNITHGITASNATVSAVVQYTYETVIMRMMGIEGVPLEATAAARAQIDNGGVACILALNETTSDAFHLQGINDSNSENCWVWVNSDSLTSVSATGASVATAQGFCTHGKVTGGEHFGPSPNSGCNRLPDPFYDKFSSYQPPSTVCDHQDLRLQSGTYTLSPGTYCGDTVIKPHADVTLLPGVYVMKHGSLDVSAGATVKGDGVTIFFWGFDTYMTVRGGADIDLKAPETGELAGFVLVDRKFDWYNSAIYETVIQGGGSIKIQGIVYAPQWHVIISGNADINQNSRCFAIVADQVHMEGNGKMHVVSDCGTAGLPDLMPRIATGPTLLQ